jgi:peptide/nickel transport system permease protein
LPIDYKAASEFDRRSVHGFRFQNSAALAQTMKRYFWQRLLQGVVALGAITLITFVIARWAPGDPLSLSDEEGRAGASLVQQGPVLVQYVSWLNRVMHLDFGRSLSDRQPVLEKIARALPMTLLLAILSLGVSWILAFFLSRSQAFPSSRPLRLSKIVLTASAVLPPYWVALLLLFLFANPNMLEMFPFYGLGDGGLLQTLWHLILPTSVMAFARLGVIAQHISSALEGTVSREDVIAARSRGLPRQQIFWQYQVRSTLVPLLAFFGQSIPSVLGGSVVIEKIFGVPGMGLLAFEAIGLRDYPTVMGVATFMACVSWLATFLTDLACAWADPRIRWEAV